MRNVLHRLLGIGFLVLAILTGCEQSPAPAASDVAPAAAEAQLILRNARVYSLSWKPGDSESVPIKGDASALAVSDGLILAVGSDTEIERYRGAATRVIDLQGATVLPGLIESHTHVFELGRKLEQVDLVGADTELDAVERVVAAAADIPAGQWIIGHGWDEGAWANSYPDKTLLSERLPDHPVLMQSLHGFAVWGNEQALRYAGIVAETPDPTGGEIRRDGSGEPTGLLLNRAAELLKRAVPVPADEDLRRQLLLALEQMLADGYVSVHEAGVTGQQMRVLETLAAEDELPLRFYSMLSLRDEPLIEKWLTRQPDTDNSAMLVTRAVKAYFDGALGSRGARLLADYSDQPGHRGISGAGYAFNAELARRVVAGGYQIAMHAIGDSANRATLDFIEAQQKSVTERHRIEHAQVIHADDMARFAELGVVASMQPPHAVEDMTWAEERVGPDRISGAYAWRTLRDSGAVVAFNADNPGSDHSIFYGLHAAVTRRNKALEPAAGWYAEQALSMDETLRAYTTAGAYASFREEMTGELVAGKWADLTVLDIDPFELAQQQPARLLDGNVVMTVVAGAIRYQNLP